MGGLEGRSNTGFLRVPVRLASRARTISQFWYDSSLSGLLSTLTPVPGIRLPSASIRCCDSEKVVVSHLHSVKERLAAHDVGDPRTVRHQGLNWRLTTSAGWAAAGSVMVVNTGFPRCTPRSPAFFHSPAGLLAAQVPDASF